MLVDDAQTAQRKTKASRPFRPDATPWQMLYGQTVTQLADGATIRHADTSRQIAKVPPWHH
ncbi:hypothetical protein ASG68_27955 [Rhizobium sp. Leaf453]|nr:hypothetical protein ASG68_27955 [Rhizobium sp. Leaf453]